MASFAKYAVMAIVGAGVAIAVWRIAAPSSDAGIVKVSVPTLSSLAMAGEVAFEATCAACHGKNAARTENGPPLVHDTYNPGHHPDESFYLAARRGTRQHHWSFGDMPPQELGCDGETVLGRGPQPTHPHTGAKTMKSRNPMTFVTALLILIGGASIALAQSDAPVVDEHHLEEPDDATAAAPDDPTMQAPPAAEGSMPGMMGMMEMMRQMQEMRMQQMEQMQVRMQQMMMGSPMGMGAGADPSAMMMARGMGMCPMMMPGMMGGSGMGIGSGAMMDSQGPGGMMGGMGMSAGVSREMTPELVREWLTQRLAGHGHARLAIGDVVSAEDGSIVAEIVTVDGSLVHKLAFNRYPGLFREVE